MKGYLVTVRSSHSELPARFFWKNTDTPLILRHPMRTLLEKNGDSIRVRHLETPVDQITLEHIPSIPIESLERKDCVRIIPKKTDDIKSIEIQSLRSLRPALSGTHAPSLAQSGHEEAHFFRRSLQGTVLTLGILLALTWAWPNRTPEITEEELIPAQFASVVMSELQKSEAEPAGGTNADTATQAEQSQVVQAFRTEALQNSVSNLLQGGMTQLLSQSHLLSANPSKDSKRIFEGQASPQPNAQGAANNIQTQKIQIAATGGNTPGTGYGNGKNAQIQGQGRGSVAIDALAPLIEEGLTKDEVGKVIHAHMQEVRYCYESLLIHSPDLEGKLVVDFKIDGQGKVAQALAKESSLKDPRLDDCLVRRLKRWTFPAPKGGVTVGVSYPFLFKSLGR